VFVDYLELMLRYTAVVPTCLHFFESVTDLHSFQGQLISDVLLHFETETNEGRSQSFPNQTEVQINQNRDSNKPPNNTKPEVKSNDKKPWNYAKGSGDEYFC
jgi:hypothetical protein